VGSAKLLFETPCAIADRKKHIGLGDYHFIANHATVILTKNMRTTDENYISLQNDIRLGIWNDHIKNQICARYGVDFDTTADDSYVPVLVCKNKTRAMLEELKLAAYSLSCKEEDELPILVTANLAAKGRAKPINHKERELIYDLPDSETSKIAMAISGSVHADQQQHQHILFTGSRQSMSCRWLGVP
jgi:hypothetical protein